MALLFIDSFDHYSTAEINKKWIASPDGYFSISSTKPRTGEHSLLVAGSDGRYKKPLSGNYRTLYVGAAFYFSSVSSPSNLFYFMDASGTQCSLYLNSGGNLSFYRGNGTLLETSALALYPAAYMYIEVKAIIGTSDGAYEVRVNGVTWISGTNVNTGTTGNAYANALALASPINTYIDDVYICDDSGSFNNSFLGDVKVECLIPNNAGAYSEWTPTPAGINYTNVDEIPPDSDTSYVAASGIGLIDTYGYANLTTTSGTVFGIQMCPFARKDDAGSRIVSPIYYLNSVIYSGSSFSLSDTYLYYPQVQQVNPNTNSAWNISEINTLEAGLKLVS